MDREIFDLYTDYIISSMGSRTATGLSDLTDGEVSHDTVTRFLSNMGLEKSPTRTVRTHNNHIFSCLCAFVKLECLSMKKHLNHFALKYKLILKANQIALTELRKMQA